MKFSGIRKSLLLSLESAAKLVSVGSTLPVLKSVLLTATADGLVKVRLTDLDAHFEDNIACNVETSGAAVVDYASLVRLLKAQSSEMIEIGLVNREKMLRVGAAKLVVNQDPADWPEQPFQVKSAGVVLPVLFFDVLTKLLPFMSKDVTRPNLCGVCIFPAGQMVATDGHRLGMYQGPKVVPEQFKAGVFLADTVIKQLLHLYSKRKGLEVFRISFDAVQHMKMPQAVRIQVGVSCELTAKVPDIVFPDYTQVVPTEAASIFDVDRRELVRLLNIASMTGSQNAALEFEDGQLTVSSENADTGVFSERVPVRKFRRVEQSWKSGLSIKYLKDACAMLPLDHEYNVRISRSGDEEGSPLKLQSGAMIVVVMPLRMDLNLSAKAADDLSFPHMMGAFKVAEPALVEAAEEKPKQGTAAAA